MTSDQAHKLTLKQERFVIHYVATGNASLAYSKAGYNTTTDLATRVNASRLLTNANVQQAVQQMKAELAQSQQITPEWTLQKLKERADQTENLAASVSSLRTIADILGMTAGNARELPDALNAMLEAVARGLAAGSKQAGLPAGRTLEILPPERPGDSEQDGSE